MNKYFEEVDTIVQKFDPVHLEEMDGVKLMNRTDTKFVFPIKKFPQILSDALPFYKVLEIENTRTLKYETDYFDTDSFEMYIKHHNGKLNRYKVRRREYKIDGIKFLEVKFKNNKGRTMKKRIMTEPSEVDFGTESAEFLKKTCPFSPESLKHKLTNSFTRITLANKSAKERITLDMNLGFKNEEIDFNLPFFVIAEVKQEGFSMSSDFIQLLKKYSITPTGMSKYCIGTALLNPSIKQNRFKEKLLNLKKISGNDSSFIDLLQRVE